MPQIDIVTFYIQVLWFLIVFFLIINFFYSKILLSFTSVLFFRFSNPFRISQKRFNAFFNLYFSLFTNKFNFFLFFSSLSKNINLIKFFNIFTLVFMLNSSKFIYFNNTNSFLNLLIFRQKPLFNNLWR